jgi:hypothetical protein
MPNKSFSFISLFLLMVVALFGLMGCNSSGVNSKDSVTSGTTTGFGGSGGTAAQVTVVAGNSQIGVNGTTPITVIVTDSQGRRTDASVILTSSLGGSFNVTSTNTGSTTVSGGGSNTTVTTTTSNTILTTTTAGGVLTSTYTAVLAPLSSPVDTQITAFIVGTTIKGSATVTITP